MTAKEERANQYQLARAAQWELVKEHGTLSLVDQDVTVLPNGLTSLTVAVHFPTALLPRLFGEAQE